MTARNFVWLSTTGGAWTLGSNWADMTDGISPSLVPPGAGDSVTVTGPSGAQIQTITGNGAALAAMFAGNSLLSGAFSFGTLTVGANATGGLLQLGPGAALTAGDVEVASGSLLAGRGSVLSTAGTLTLGTQGGAPATLNATGGASASVFALRLGSGSDNIYVDPASILEVGGAGDGAAGALTIDVGATLSGQGNADKFGRVVNNGTVAASGGTLTVGATTGVGSLQIGAGATLALNGTCAAGQTIAFSAPNATLSLNQEAFAPTGTLTGFAPGDAIDVRGSSISQASFAATGGSSGLLTLYYGGQVAARLNLAGSYAGNVFVTAGDGAGGTLITVAAGAGGAGGVSPGTSTPDQYIWTASGSGAWNQAANWQDLTSGAAPAGIAPGAANLVSIAAAQDIFTVIAGPANAASLSLRGEVALGGAYQIGALTVGEASGADFTPATLDLLASAALTARTAGIAAGAISVSGSAALLSVAGTLVLGGSTLLGVGLPTAALTVAAGGGVRAGALVMGGGSGASLTTDPSGWVEVGTAGGAAAGAVTIDPGAVLSGNGTLNPLGTIVDNGTILATGGTLTVGSVSGTGSLAIDVAATLELIAATGAPIAFGGSQQAGGSVLALASVRAAPTGTLTGFALGDAIDLEGSALTSVQFSANATGGSLLLIYGTTVVARVALAGSFAGQHFILTPDGGQGSLITLVPNAGGGGSGGQTGTDQLAWATQGSGNWNRAASWMDMTTGSPATLPPGAQTQVEIDGPTGTSFQSVAGTGTCNTLELTGNTALSGSYTTGLLTVGQAAMSSADAVEGALDIGPNSVLVATAGTIASGELLCLGAGASVSVSGTLALDGGQAGVGLPDTLLAAGGHGVIQLGGLTLGGGSSAAVTVDSTAILEVGSAGGAVAGVLTVDAGALVSGNGTLNAAGPVADNGGIVAQGGTLLVGGAVGGAGTLGIGTGATLVLGGADGCEIDFVGGGATLVMPGTAQLPTGHIADFAAGDRIVVGSAVDGVDFTPGTAGAGTLSLSLAGQVVGQLLLDGDFTGNFFSVQPYDGGAAIVLSPVATDGPPPGTLAPDAYSWTGAAGTSAWKDAGNWVDTTLGAGPATLAPGQANAVSIIGGAGAVLAVTGPADAARLSIAGTVSLAGLFDVGTLAVGSAQAEGVLALGRSGGLAAGSAQISGGLAVGGGDFSTDGTLSLSAGAVLAVSGGSAVTLGAVVMGQGSALATDDASSIEVGGQVGAALGSITIHAGARLSGAGAVGLSGEVVDDGTVCASGGTLVLGDVSGTGTLLASDGADLVLTGTVDGGLIADFAGAGTLTLAGGAAPAITDFGTGDTILLPGISAVSASYALTGPGIGVLSLADDTGQVLTRLTLLGDQNGRSFSVADAGDGGTILTTLADTTSGQGEDTMGTSNFATGQIDPGVLLGELAGAFPYFATADFLSVTGNVANNVFLYYSTDGLPPDETPAATLGSPFPVTGIEVVAPLNGQTGAGGGPGIGISMQPGYKAVLLQGNENIQLTDGQIGHALLVGNYGTDAIAALGEGDTLVGAPGASTTFYAALQNANSSTSQAVDVYIHGGGNDGIATNYDNSAITTSGGHSSVFLGPANSSVMSYGTDSIYCGGQGGNDTIQAMAGAGRAGDLVFGSPGGYLEFHGGDAPSTVVGNGGFVSMQGGNGSGSLFWAGSSDANYTGGAGSALIVAGSGQTSIQGGSGPVTVFGGTGNGVFAGAPGSVFVVGAGPSTVRATGGNAIFLIGSAPVSIAGSNGANVYGGSSTGNNVFQATAGNETLWGGAGNDQFMAGPGNDIFVAGGGSDMFSFTNGTAGGVDTVVGFVPGQSTIALHGFGSQAPSMYVAYGDTVINLSGGAQIILENVTNLTPANFTFT